MMPNEVFLIVWLACMWLFLGVTIYLITIFDEEK